jgi:hypothetical protein
VNTDLRWPPDREKESRGRGKVGVDEKLKKWALVLLILAGRTGVVIE